MTGLALESDHRLECDETNSIYRQCQARHVKRCGLWSLVLGLWPSDLSLESRGTKDEGQRPKAQYLRLFKLFQPINHFTPKVPDGDVGLLNSRGAYRWHGNREVANGLERLRSHACKCNYPATDFPCLFNSI